MSLNFSNLSIILTIFCHSVCVLIQKHLNDHASVDEWRVLMWVWFIYKKMVNFLWYSKHYVNLWWDKESLKLPREVLDHGYCFAIF